MTYKPNVALLINASGSLAHRKIFAEISLESRASQVMPLTFSTECGILNVIHAVCCI